MNIVPVIKMVLPPVADVGVNEVMVGGLDGMIVVYMPRPCVAAINLLVGKSKRMSMMTVCGSLVDRDHVAPPSCDHSSPTSVATYSVDGLVRESTSTAFTGASGRLPEMLVQVAPKS